MNRVVNISRASLASVELLTRNHGLFSRSCRNKVSSIFFCVPIIYGFMAWSIWARAVHFSSKAYWKMVTVGDGILPKFKQIRAFMHILLTCKNEVDQIKN